MPGRSAPARVGRRIKKRARPVGFRRRQVLVAQSSAGYDQNDRRAGRHGYTA